MSYARQQQNSEFKLKYFTLNGIELAYVRKGKYERIILIEFVK